MEINKKANRIQVKPKLVYINESVPMDSATNVVVNKWMTIAENNYASLGFDARKVLLATGNALDGRETTIRSTTSNLTQLIVEAMVHAAPKADVALFNAGSVRVDDVLPMPLTQYDLIRALPFGGGLQEVKMKGSLLIQVLTQGRLNKGLGGFLHYNKEVNYNEANQTWMIKNKPIDASAIYRVVTTEFLLSGKEINLDFFNKANPQITEVYKTEGVFISPMSDIRLAIIKYAEAMHP